MAYPFLDEILAMTVQRKCFSSTIPSGVIKKKREKPNKFELFQSANNFSAGKVTKNP